MIEEVKLILKNGRKYTGIILKESDEKLKIKDKLGYFVEIDKEMISERIEEK